MSAELLEEFEIEGADDVDDTPDIPATPSSASRDAFLSPDQPVEIEGRNPRRRHRFSETLGDIWIVEYEVDETTWRNWAAMPRTATVISVTWWNDGDAPDKPVKRQKAAKAKNGKKPKVPKGANGELWNSLVKRGFWTFPGVGEALNLNGGGQKEALCAMRNEFNTDTLATISAGEIATWARKHEMGGPNGFLNLVRQVSENLEERQSKAS